ncbi:50S ribosomal protein L11 methyltransferase [Aestuariibius sp. HNIBRBA575]|uniref:50S ribosomal protein L11 methyltransferase n=1 Tax=Aestuariibius sp. HNIBRBA575 TaxID=3233343 RepID=UPI0034A3F251
MPTFTALTTLTGKAKAEKLGEAMENLMPEPTGVGVFEIEDGSDNWEVGGYFEDTPDAASLALLAASFDATPYVVAELPETDWITHVQNELKPVPAGRFFVYGSHDADKVPADKIGLLVDAALAFGTGHHGTTLGCLKALDSLVERGFVAHNVADIGCGTAVLAMAAAHVYPNPALASDIDPVAIEVAEDNVRANNMTGRVNCVVAAGFDAPALADAAPFDLIFANILKPPLIALAPDMARAAAPGAYAILSGLLNEQADEIIAVYAQNGFNLVENNQIGEWTTLILNKI